MQTTNQYGRQVSTAEPQFHSGFRPMLRLVLVPVPGHHGQGVKRHPFGQWHQHSGPMHHNHGACVYTCNLMVTTPFGSSILTDKILQFSPKLSLKLEYMVRRILI
jgi:hypothetical protein